MKGDFSKWQFDEQDNFAGVLHQQGRVLLDADWNAQTRITNHWQDTSARDTIGPGVAAVPADDHDAFKVTEARVEEARIKVRLAPGRVWADGLLVHLEEEIELVADYFDPPIQEPPDTPNGADTRDAVILEVWREAVNGFQEPQSLIEPALGGPDTTERVHTAMALRLLRLGPGQACENIQKRLRADLNSRPLLNVYLEPTGERNGDCPTFEGGGYTGLEHHLYRIEIAETNRPESMFKWSQFNGGLVGRGVFHIEDGETYINIRANHQVIATSGMERFYLEIVGKDPELGHSHVSYAAEVVLSGDRLTVDGGSYYEQNPPSTEEEVFFRLWNGIKNVSEYEIAITGPHPLHNGIELDFNPPPSRAVYRPGDYWTFSVRAGQNNNPWLIRRQPPEGIEYHRVSLAELHWTNASEPTIEDCRHVFRPLTRQKACCTFFVGDGEFTHGDFDSIQEAIDKLPWWGGLIRLLPGTHFASVTIQGKFNIRIKGCDLRTLVLPAVTGEPVFSVTNSWFIAVEHMLLVTFGGTAIEMEGGGWNEIGHNTIFAYRHAVRVSPWVNMSTDARRSYRALHNHIHNNVIRMLDRTGGDVAIHFAGEEGLIEHNNIAVIPFGTGSSRRESGEELDPADECVEPELIEIDKSFVRKYAYDSIKIDLSSFEPLNPFKALGGIQLCGNSWRVKIRDNKIFGGDGNGITLGTGSLIPVPEETETTVASAERTVDIDTAYVTGSVELNGTGVDGVTVRFAGARIHTDTTEADGYFGFAEVLQGTYTVTVETEGYKIENISLASTVGTANMLKILIEVREVEIEPETSDQFAFLYEIEILNNKIAQVGLCGIGFPSYLPLPQFNAGTVSGKSRAHLQMGNPVIGLNIRENHIKNCLQNADTAITLLGRSRGLGGISLGMCEDLTIRENRIEDNGRDHRDPVCGIYAAYAAQADISDNHLINNGPLNVQADTNVLPGLRGGIVLRNALSITLAGVVKTKRPAAPPATEPMAPVLVNAVRVAAALGGYAVRIHDNLVKQPVGHALHISALGPVSVANNQFVTDFIEPKPRRALAGAVFITNHGQPYYIRRFMKFPFPSGSVIFSNNRIRLSVADCWTSQTIISADDVAYLGNHSDIMEEVRPILFNALIGALTLRASENKFQEMIGLAAFGDIIYDLFGYEPPGGALNGSNEPKASLFSYGVFMNNTTNNQGNHCLLAVGVAQKPVDSDNQVLVVPLDKCKGYQDWLNNNYSRRLLPGFAKLGVLSI